MNALIPALLVVLLAEIGGPLTALAIRRPNFVAFLIAILVFAGAGIGWQFSSMMMPNARTLMLGVLIAFAATSQIWAGKPLKDTLFATVLGVFRSPAPGLAFGLAAWSGEPLTPALGALFAVALAAGVAGLDVPISVTTRRISGAILFAGGIVVAGAALEVV